MYMYPLLQEYMKKLLDEIGKSDPGRVEQFKASAKLGVKKVSIYINYVYVELDVLVHIIFPL